MAFNSNPGELSFIATAGQTDFDFNFKIFKNTDILVYQTPDGQNPDDANDILTLTTDYTVTITGDAGGKVTLVTGAGIDDTLVLRRNLPAIRDIEYQTSGDMLATTLNEDQDYQTYLIADTTLVNTKSITIPDSATGVNTQLQNVVPSYFLRWDATGTQIENAQAVVQEITEFKDSVFKILKSSNIAITTSFILDALTTSRTITMPDANVDLGDIANSLNTSSTAQTKVGDLTIGQEITISSWSFIATTITINTAVPHNLIVGQKIRVNGLVSITNTPQGIYAVATVEDTNTISFTAADTPTGSPTVSSATLNSGDIEAKGGFVGKNACTAWVNFDGTTTPPTIRDSFNVSDIIDNGVGDYNLVFEEPMDTINFVWSSNLASLKTFVAGYGGTNKFVTGFRFATFRVDNSTIVDSPDIMIMVFGGKN